MEKTTKISTKNCRFFTLYKSIKMRYNDKAPQLVVCARRSALCAECQSYDTNACGRLLSDVHFLFLPRALRSAPMEERENARLFYCKYKKYNI